MPQLDRSGLCEFVEYQQAFNERLYADQLKNSEIIMLYLRLERLGQAVKAPVQVKTTEQNLGGLILDVTLLDEDLKVPRGTTPSKGEMINGVWNASRAKDQIGYVDGHGHSIPAHDGVFQPYDDGLGMRFFEKALVGVSVRSITDLGSFRT